MQTQTHRIIRTGGIVAPQLEIPTTPAEHIAAARRAWFAADMAHARAFLRADRREMARLDVEREALLESYHALTRCETLPTSQTPDTVELEEDDSLPLEPLTDIIEEEPEYARCTVLDKRVQSKAETRCYAIAREPKHRAYLDINAPAAMLNGINAFLCDRLPDFQPVSSRKDLSEKHWVMVGNAIKGGVFGYGWHYRRREDRRAA